MAQYRIPGYIGLLWLRVSFCSFSCKFVQSSSGNNNVETVLHRCRSSAAFSHQPPQGAAVRHRARSTYSLAPDALVSGLATFGSFLAAR